MSGRQRGGRRWFAAGLATAALAAALSVVAWPRPAAAKPGMVTNLQGQTFAGDVTEDEKFVFVSTPGGQMRRIDKRNVAKVDYSTDVQARYDEWHAKLKPDDVAGRMDLANWANDQARPDLAVRVLTEARQIAPTNRDVALALDTAERQVDLDRSSRRTAKAKAAGPSTAPAMATTAMATTAAVPAMEHRLLTTAEVNVIRQREMPTADPLVRVRLENDVEFRYLKLTGVKPAAFNQLSGEEQALEILTHGTPEMAKDVHVVTDPTPLHEFKVKVMPIIAQACASNACHGGTHAGNFMLYTGEGTQALYTNFYVLQEYSARLGGAQYFPIDRSVPARSLVLQYGLPTIMAQPPHPAVAGLRPRFKDRSDPAYGTVFNWVTHSLTAIQPTYGIDVSPVLPPPTTAPAATMSADTPTAPPPPSATTRRTPAHGRPLPRTPSGAVTQPAS